MQNTFWNKVPSQTQFSTEFLFSKLYIIIDNIFSSHLKISLKILFLLFFPSNFPCWKLVNYEKEGESTYFKE